MQSSARAQGTFAAVMWVVTACQADDFTVLPEVTDRFEQVQASEVDILWVLDNSESMIDEQTLLAENFNSFIGALEGSGIRYHVGIVTTDTEAAGHAGQLQGDPRVIEPGPQAQTFFRNNVNRIIDEIENGGGGDTFERGLEAARMALTEPRVSGSNVGFLRPAAALFVILVSDEDDSSYGQTLWFARFFESLKGAGNDRLVTVNAIVGDDAIDLGPENKGCVSRDESGVQTALWGQRYIEVARETEGLDLSICDRDFARSLGSLGISATGLRSRFPLSNVPAGGRIESVTIDDEPAAPGSWHYEPGENEIVFETGHTPGPGAVIVVVYRVG
jgi:hypothetical protein